MAATEPIGLYALAYYIKRIRFFLESDKKTLSFPHISSQLQDVLVKIITEGTEFVHNDPQFDDSAKMEAAKLTAAFEAQCNTKLIHEFQDGVHGMNVLVYKKNNVTPSKPPDNITKPSEEQKIASTDLKTTDLLSTSFKLNHLNVTANFVKDDSQLVLKYPKMVPCEAEFIMNMLLQGKEGKLEQTNVGYGFRSMYAPLWESMKLFSLKYDYKIEYIPLLDTSMKCIVFEKIPKSKKPKSKDVEVTTKLNNSISSTSSSSVLSNTTLPAKPKKLLTRTVVKQQTLNRTVGKKKLKLVAMVETLISNKYISEEFICTALHRISDFLYEEAQASILFYKVDSNLQYFLEHVEALSKTDMAYMLFNSECQKYLCDIRYCVSKNILYQTRLLKYGSKKHPFKDLIFEKRATYNTKEKREENEENVCNNIQQCRVDLNAALSQNDQKRLVRLKAIKDKITRTDGEIYILDRLQEIAHFLTKDNKETNLVIYTTTPEQALFIKFVHVLSKLDDAYAMFTRECQDLLRSIKVNAKNYELQFHWEIDDENNTLTEITITKKPIKVKLKEEETKRSRSLSGVRRSPRLAEKTAQEKKERERGSSGQRPLNRREKLLEGLNQPVQSDKAVKIMQSMGWTGGALGLRGEGITEPIMPSIDIAKRAGLGHVPTPKKVAQKKPKCNASKQDPISCLLPQGIMPVASLPQNLLPPGILLGLPPNASTKIIYLSSGYHIIVLRSILELITTDIVQMHFVYTAQKTRPRKVANFIKQAVQGYNNRSRIGLSDRLQLEIVEETMVYFDNNRDLMLSSEPIDKGVIMKKRGYKPDLKVPKSKSRSSRQWYPPTLEIYTNVEHPPTKPQQQLLAAILKPVQEETTISQMQQQDVNLTTTIRQNTKGETKNIQTPPDLKTLALRRLQGLRTDFEIPTGPANTNTSQTPDVKTTITQKQLTVEETIEQKTVELEKSNVQVLQELKNGSLDYPQDTPKEVQKLQEAKKVTRKMKKETETKQRPWQIKTVTAQKLKEAKKTLRSSRRKRKRRRTEQKEQTTIKTIWQHRKQFKALYPQIAQRISTDSQIQEMGTSANTSETQNVKATISQQQQEVKTTTIPNLQKEITETTQKMTKDTQTSQGYILLEKFPANNNDTTQNKNTDIVNNVNKTFSNKTPTSALDKNNATSVAKEPRIIDYVDLTGDVMRKLDIKDDRQRKVETVENKTAAIAIDVKEIKDTDKINDILGVTNISSNDNTQHSDKSAYDTIEINRKVANFNHGTDRIEQNDQHDTDTVSYEFLVETKTIADPDNILIDTAINKINRNNTNENDNSNDTQEANTDQSITIDNSDMDSLVDYEDTDDCQIILDDSGTMIEIDSEDENNLLVSDDETEPKNATPVKAGKIFANRLSRDIVEVNAIDYMTNDTIKTEKDELDSVKNRKRPSVELEDADVTKKCKLLADFKNLYILPKDYPQKRIDNEKAGQIQTCILNAIDYTKEKLPLLSCQGIQNGGLMYSCQDEESLFFMEDLIKTMSDLKIVYEFVTKEKKSHKMAFRINSFIDEPVMKILYRLELYNNGLNASKWGFVKKEQYGDFIVIYVEIDESSHNYICNANFVLYAGNDCARFTIVWD